MIDLMIWVFWVVLLVLLFRTKKACAKGGGSSSTHDAYKEKPAELQALESSFYNVVNPLAKKYGSLVTQNMADAANQAATANNTYDTLAGQATGLLGGAQTALERQSALTGQAGAAGDPWYAKSMSAYDTARDLLGQQAGTTQYASDTSKWYDDYARGQLSGAANMMNTGEIPEAIAAALRAETDRGLQGSIGSSLASLASRGVLNSSVTNKGMSDLSQAAGDAYNRNYLNAFNTALQGYQGNANTAANAGSSFANALLNIGNSLGNQANSATSLGQAYGNTGSQRVGDLLNVANSYGDTASGYGNLLASNQAERQGLLEAVPQFYSNAAAPLSMANSFLRQQQEDFWNTGKIDTVVRQGK